MSRLGAAPFRQPALWARLRARPGVADRLGDRGGFADCVRNAIRPAR